jgi:DNA polymerase elongation subunit (family B)
MFDFLRTLIEFFDKHSIPYMLSGSVAMSAYTIPRFTRDIDFVIHLQKKDVPELMKYFDSGYYIDEEAVNDAIKRESMFNIMDYGSGYKADFLILKNEAFSKSEFNRRKKVHLFGISIHIVSAEDLLISKIIWIQELQREDIKQLSKTMGLDWSYINEWIKELKLKTFNLLPQ